MSEKKNNENIDKANFHFGFRKENYKILFIGLAVNVLGYLLMIGGGSKDPNVFTGDQLFNSTRLTISPLLILIGFGIIIYAIMRKSKSTDTTEK
ncbi:MAG: DUF3098 domain-containing protein [Crocinitomicaceae bacterium]|nr:DUF3098 domain-containing protein [Crocinitomicaceae bacterium]